MRERVFFFSLSLPQACARTRAHLLLSPSLLPLSSPFSLLFSPLTWTCGSASYRRACEDREDPGKASPPMATPSARPSVDRASTAYSSLLIPPLLATQPTLPGRCRQEATRLSTVPPASPMRNRPAATAPTVAGPIRVLPDAAAAAMRALVSASGTPSAMTATVRMVGTPSASAADAAADRKEAREMKTSAPGWDAAAAAVDPYTGRATSVLPKKTLWKPGGAPGWTMAATEGVSRPGGGERRGERGEVEGWGNEGKEGEVDEKTENERRGRVAPSLPFLSSPPPFSLSQTKRTAQVVKVQHALGGGRLPIEHDGLERGGGEEAEEWSRGGGEQKRGGARGGTPPPVR